MPSTTLDPSTAIFLNFRQSEELLFKIVWP